LADYGRSRTWNIGYLGVNLTGTLITLLNTLLDFFKNNYVFIIVILVTAIVVYLAFYLTTSSLKKLKTSIFTSYPFDLFFPHEGTWSVGYFLIIVLFLGLLIYFLGKGNFVLGPA